MTHTDVDRIQQRYGLTNKRSRSLSPLRKLHFATIAIGVSVIGIIGAYFYQRHEGTASVSAQIRGYTVVSPQQVIIYYSVTRRNPLLGVSCIVQAENKNKTNTGRREVYIPPNTLPVVEMTTHIKTFAPSSYASVQYCSTKIPAYLHPTKHK